MSVPRLFCMPTTIFGSWWGGNLGDTAILKATIAALRSVRDAAEDIVVHSSNPDLLSSYLAAFDGVEIRPVRNNYWGRATPKSLVESDEVIVGGGGLFFPDHVANPYRNHLVNLAPIALLARALGVERHVLCVGANRMDGVLSETLASTVLRGASTVTARDQATVEILSQYTDGPVTHVPDPAFTLDAAETRTVADRTADVPAETVVLSLHEDLTRHRPDLDLDRCARAIADAVGDYAVENDYDVLLYNNYVFSDWLDGLADAFGPDVTVHTVETAGLQPEEAVAMFSQFELAVCSQMHANVMSLLAGTPNVAVEYDPKVRRMMALVGREDHVVGLARGGDRQRETMADDLRDAMATCPPVDEERVAELGDAFESHVEKL